MPSISPTKVAFDAGMILPWSVSSPSVMLTDRGA
jgi:hypothetical protein